MNAKHLRLYVVRPVLMHLELHSPAAEDLVMGTAAQESHLVYLRQLVGPAFGLWQMEPTTHDDLWRNYLAYHPQLAGRVRSFLAPGHADVAQLVWNLAYGAAMCRIHYRRIKAPLPPAGDVGAMARYWKTYYNTRLGKGKPEEFVRNYDRVLGVAA